MNLAITIAECRSKDPNTKVGAVVYDPVTGNTFLGYNGFPAGFPDTKERWECREFEKEESKYHYVVHAEANAVRKAAQALGDQVSRCILYVTHYPCNNCMKDWIASFGIREVHYNDSYPVNVKTDIIANELAIDMHLFERDRIE